MLLFYVFVWFACGILAAGWIFVFFQKDFPTLAKEDHVGDMAIAYLTLVLGVSSLMAVVIFMAFMNGPRLTFKYGWSFPA